MEFLERKPLLPLTTLLTVDAHSPYYHEEDKGPMFYSESWALAHYLKTKDNHENTHRVDDYLELMHKGVDNITAATRAFGDLEQLQTDLQKYLVNSNYGFASVPASNQVDDSTFSVEQLSKTQSGPARAELMACVGRTADARNLLDPVLRDDPRNGRAHLTWGMWPAAKGITMNPTSGVCKRSNSMPTTSLRTSARLPVGCEKARQTPTALAQMESDLRAVVHLNPNFSPGYDGLATVMGMPARTSEKLRPTWKERCRLSPETSRPASTRQICWCG